MRTIAISTALASALALTTVSALAIELNPFSYVKGAVEAVVEDRSAGDIAKDAEIKAKIFAAITDELGASMVAFNNDVYEQDVMLTGVVEDPKEKERAGEVARRVEGVKKVYNEVLVIPAVKQQKGTVENFVDDTVIETKINAVLLDAKGVNTTNFRWRSVGGHVFLFGRALSQEELNKAIRVVKGVEKVTQITNRVKVKPKS